MDIVYTVVTAAIILGVLMVVLFVPTQEVDKPLMGPLDTEQFTVRITTDNAYLNKLGIKQGQYRKVLKIVHESDGDTIFKVKYKKGSVLILPSEFIRLD